MTHRFIVRPFCITIEDDLEAALEYAEAFSELDLDIHVERITHDQWEVVLYLPSVTPLITVRGGIVRDIRNMPPGLQIIVADYDNEGLEPVIVKIIGE